MERKKYLECGRIVNTHGVRGAVKLESLCDSPEVLASLERVFFCEGSQYKAIKVINASVFKNAVIATFEGIDDIDKAALLKNKLIYASREDFDLDDGVYFIADLTGLPVIDEETGRVYGKITDVINRGASDIYVVEDVSGKERMIPVVDEFIKRTDLDTGVYVHNIPGLLTDD